ncbi:MAG: serine/threonine protein kinase [Coriobacteriales bacterium]
MELLEIIGHGSTGDVHSATITTSGKSAKAAVKILRPELSGTVSEERFLRECKLLERLSHPNIVGGLGSGRFPESSNENAGMPFCVMEKLDGGSLSSRIKDGICIRDAISITAGIASALGYIQMDGRILAHRDIKPQNIMFDSGGTPKLIDLGIAKTRVMATNALQTRLAGTVRYMSPEQIADSSHIDIRSDIYSLGVVLKEMVAGPDSIGEGRDAVARKFEREDETLDRLVAKANLDDHGKVLLGCILEKMCAYEPFDRYQSPAELESDLWELIEHIDSKDSQRTRRQTQALRIHPYAVSSLNNSNSTRNPKKEQRMCCGIPFNRCRNPSKNPNERKHFPKNRKISREASRKTATIALIAVTAVLFIFISIFAIDVSSATHDSEQLEAPPSGKDIVLDTPATSIEEQAESLQVTTLVLATKGSWTRNL